MWPKLNFLFMLTIVTFEEKGLHSQYGAASLMLWDYFVFWDSLKISSEIDFTYHQEIMATVCLSLPEGRNLEVACCYVV